MTGHSRSNHILKTNGKAFGGERLLCSGGHFGELRIEVGQRARELFAIARILIGLQLFCDAGAREQQHLRLPPRFDFNLREALLPLAIFLGLKFLNLPFHGFAFPSPGHP
jgi:hypothetical protein